LLILKAGSGGWKKRAVFTQPGEAGLSLAFVNRGELVWITRVECDSCCDD